MQSDFLSEQSMQVSQSIEIFSGLSGFQPRRLHGSFAALLASITMFDEIFIMSYKQAEHGLRTDDSIGVYYTVECSLKASKIYWTWRSFHFWH